MITIRYTTGYHKLMQIVFWGINILLILLGAFVGEGGGFAFMFLVVIILNIVRASSDGNLIEDDIAAFLYLKHSLKVDINYSESKKFSFLFKANHLGKWYPLTEVRYQPTEKRKEYLYDFVEVLRGKTPKHKKPSQLNQKDIRQNIKNDKIIIDDSAEFKYFLSLLNLTGKNTYNEITDAYNKEIKKYASEQSREEGVSLLEIDGEKQVLILAYDLVMNRHNDNK